MMRYLKKPWVKILIGLILGVITGLIFQQKIHLLDVIGKAFIDLLKMVVAILVFTSIALGICHISDPQKLGRIGLKTIVFFFVTTLCSISFALVMCLLTQPGIGLNLPKPAADLEHKAALSGLDFIANMIPSNPFAAFVNNDILQIIVFAIFFAYSIILIKEKARPVVDVLEGLSEIMHSLTHIVMRFAPIGVFALIATSIGSIGLKVITPLIILLMCNYVACLLQVVIVYSVALKVFSGLSIAPFFKGMKDAVVLAFTTSSSSATLPVTLECAREHLGISEDISGFVLSLGSTINMNGAAIGQVVASYFIANAYGIEITIFKVVLLYLTSMLSAIGAAGIPGTGIVMLAMVLGALGLPLEGIALVAGVDRLREMVSAIVNVLGDGVAAVYVAKSEKQIHEQQYHDATWID